MTVRVALTGGIASGKTAVSNRFAALGVPVIDADIAARRVASAGSAGLQQLTALCGDTILLPDGNLNRRALREQIFADASLRERVNQLLHPLIRADMQAESAQRPYPYQLFVIPLLVETGQADSYDRVLLVQAEREQRLQRLMQRDRIDAAAATAILAAQASDKARLAIADDVIDNNGDEQALAQQVESLHQRYLALAQSPNP